MLVDNCQAVPYTIYNMEFTLFNDVGTVDR